MITIDALREFGADTEEGLGRCLKNETFYLRLVNMALDDANFGKLEQAVAGGDKQAAFDAAHALKGVLGNLGLTPLYTAASELTELLRTDADADYPALTADLLAKLGQLSALRDA